MASITGETFPDVLKGNKKYRKVRDLNRGSYGFVVLAEDLQEKQRVAVKFLQRGEQRMGGAYCDEPLVILDGRELSSCLRWNTHQFGTEIWRIGTISKYVEREITNHSVLLHPHVIQFKEVFLTDEYLGIVMEYAVGGDMFQYVKRKNGLEEREARWFFQQLVIGLDYCHRMGVVSRDIKLENTLLDGSRRPLLKICDFGYSKHEKDSVPKSKVGTPDYTAPEIISNRHDYDGKLVDVWSAGVMLYVMLYCHYPFEPPPDVDPGKKMQAILQNIARGDYRFPEHPRVSEEAKDLLRRILVVNPEKRITIKQIQNHPWYLRDLPPGLNQFNDECLKQHNENGLRANKEHVAAILKEAKLGPGQRHQSVDMGSWDEEQFVNELSLSS